MKDYYRVIGGTRNMSKRELVIEGRRTLARCTARTRANARLRAEIRDAMQIFSDAANRAKYDQALNAHEDRMRLRRDAWEALDYERPQGSNLAFTELFSRELEYQRKRGLWCSDVVKLINQYPDLLNEDTVRAQIGRMILMAAGEPGVRELAEGLPGVDYDFLVKVLNIRAEGVTLQDHLRKSGLHNPDTVLAILRAIQKKDYVELRKCAAAHAQILLREQAEAARRVTSRKPRAPSRLIVFLGLMWRRVTSAAPMK